MGYLTTKDLSRPETITGSANVQRIREEERDRIHAERALAAEVAAELKKENKKRKSGKRNTASSE